MKDYFRNQAIGANKRTRTRGLLIDSAINVFSEKGIEEASINEITAIAGLANGTFYNHFKDKDELALASAEAITLEIAKQLDDQMADLTRGVSKVIVASWAFMIIGRKAGDWANVLVSQYQRQPSVRSSAFEYMRADVALTQKQETLSVRVDDFLLEQIAALMMAAMRTMSHGGNDNSIPHRTCEHILRLLGMTPDQAAKEVETVAKHPILKRL